MISEHNTARCALLTRRPFIIVFDLLHLFRYTQQRANEGRERGWGKREDTINLSRSCKTIQSLFLKQPPPPTTHSHPQTINRYHHVDETSRYRSLSLGRPRKRYVSTRERCLETVLPQPQSDLGHLVLAAVSYWPIDTPSPANPWVQGQPMSIVWATGDGTGELGSGWWIQRTIS